MTVCTTSSPPSAIARTGVIIAMRSAVRRSVTWMPSITTNSTISSSVGSAADDAAQAHRAAVVAEDHEPERARREPLADAVGDLVGGRQRRHRAVDGADAADERFELALEFGVELDGHGLVWGEATHRVLNRQISGLL